MVPRLALIVPCYNEEEMLPASIPVFLEALENLKIQGEVKSDSYLLFIDDGSSDRTWKYIVDSHLCREEVRGIRLSRNFGQQNALYAGIMKARENCDVSVTMDADLQDDISTLPEMLKHYREGCEMVFGVRRKRSSDSLFKKYSADLYYHIQKLLNRRTIPGHADYTLMSRRVMDVLGEYGEHGLYLRGITSDMGFRWGTVGYDRKKRNAGRSSYDLPRMLRLGMSGIMQSEEWMNLLLIAPFPALVWSLVIFMRRAVPVKTGSHGKDRWTDLCVSVFLISHGLLLCLGSAILKEVLRRPRYIISDATD